ncbi:MAG: MarR family winged helix-turn-helix transcriptional regulator [Lachnospiraceae bacterium]|jgi:DNA-binding MarR family transcriptional regulator
MLQRFQAFVTGITICYKYIQRIKSTEMTEFGLKGTHVMCIFFLHYHAEGLTAAQLCQLCGEDKAAISRTLAVLREKGYLESEEKRYRSQLHLTAAGLELAEKMDRLIEQWVGFGSDGLTEEERSVFYRALERISGNLRDSIEKIS